MYRLNSHLETCPICTGPMLKGRVTCGVACSAHYILVEGQHKTLDKFARGETNGI